MKTTVMLLFAAMVTLVACEKSTVQEMTNDRNSAISSTREGAVVYEMRCCDCPDGSCGVMCAACSECDDDCEMPTPCKCNSTPNFHHVLLSRYTQEKIALMIASSARITDPELRQALIDDGMPLKKK